MSEKRRPIITIMLKIEAKDEIKKQKVEIYKASLWNDEIKNRFRLRVNGKWWPKDGKMYYYKTEIRDILWRSLPFHI